MERRRLPGIAAALARTLPALFLLALLAAACGGSDPNAPASRPTLTEPATVPTAASSEDRPPYRIGQGGVGSPAQDATVTVTPGPGSATTYTVREGDTCGAIATMFGITVPELLASNPLINDECTNLSIDEELRIPATTSAADPPTASAASSGTTRYTVVAGDTCAGIADSHGMTLQAFNDLNDLDEESCTTLSIGRTLTVPVGGGGGEE